MMRILTFFALLFGLFGVFISQYKVLYKAVYQLWTKEIVHDQDSHSFGTVDYKPCGKNGRCRICSEVETHCREACDLANILTVLFFGIFVTGLLSLFAANGYIHASNNPEEIFILRCDQALVFILLISLVGILRISHIDIFNPQNTSQIDKKLFHIWCKVNCYDSKKSFQHNLEPPRMYVLLDKNVKEYINKEGLDKKLTNNDSKKTPNLVGVLSIIYSKTVNDPSPSEEGNLVKTPCPPKDEDSYAEKIVWAFIDNLHKDPEKWECLLSRLKRTVESERWNSIYPRLGDIDKGFLRYFFTSSLVVILLLILIVFYPIKISDLFSNATKLFF